MYDGAYIIRHMYELYNVGWVCVHTPFPEWGDIELLLSDRGTLTSLVLRFS